jgi:alkylated DNA repair protein alkB family protein 7
VEESRTPTSPNKSFVNATFAPTDFESNSALVYENFITQVEGVALKKDVLARMRRRKFQKGHWDAVITDYKEVELPNHVLSKESGAAMERVRTQIEQTHFSGEEVEWIPSHAIQLRKDSDLKAHVDSVKFSGDIVAGLSLSSASIMRLKPASPSELCEHDDDITHNGESQSKSLENAGHVDLYLPPLSLYILSGVSRFRYTHELLPSNSCFQCNGDEILVERQGRISIIFRDRKEG